MIVNLYIAASIFLMLIIIRCLIVKLIITERGISSVFFSFHCLGHIMGFS